MCLVAEGKTPKDVIKFAKEDITVYKLVKRARYKSSYEVVVEPIDVKCGDPNISITTTTTEYKKKEGIVTKYESPYRKFKVEIGKTYGKTYGNSEPEMIIHGLSQDLNKCVTFKNNRDVLDFSDAMKWLEDDREKGKKKIDGIIKRHGIEGFLVNGGFFHSYADLTDLRVWESEKLEDEKVDEEISYRTDFVIVKCTIPKGSYYIDGYLGYDNWYYSYGALAIAEYSTDTIDNKKINKYKSIASTAIRYDEIIWEPSMGTWWKNREL